MALLSKALNAIGLLLLAHAVYSAHEHSALHAGAPSTSQAPSTTAALPLDITLETLTSVFLVCAGLVLGSPALRPIQWSEWAGEVEQEEGRQRQGRGKAGMKEGEGVGNPFRMLEERPGFVDVRAKRKEFADWVREGGSR
ncbi:hypothetical protein W97_00579 [Coniosporium apollinis CBS 100218]|uniref:Magnesium transporter n=1 Tax=Coniosporium apollinis (strain CBS 100218) TaxID=1168221 RepID=R7YHH9_CONA1|nr:uncharacterized protein W97_00579 [Coniosporium apollinis CBS 100218]EON61365.1 hypothetical protein W97_00579 [Coniosporium apollinis CBS 100218]